MTSTPVDRLTVVGQASLDCEGRLLHEGDPAAQLALSLANLEAALDRAGVTPAEIERICLHVTDIRALLDAYDTVTEFLGGARPLISINEVAELTRPGMAVAVDATARRRTEHHATNQSGSTHMTAVEKPASRLAPLEIAKDTFVIQAISGEGEGPLAVHMNAMLIRGEQPVVVDTGTPIDRETYLADLFSLVEPEDVRWVFLSHEDVDHYGNVMAVMAACPNATLVASWFLCQRLGAGGDFQLPPTRWRWVGNGESFDAGDRTLHAIRPPLYDSPTTRGLFDPTTGVYWASDAYATPVPTATPLIGDLDQDFWRDGFAMFQSWNSPWVTMLDRAKFQAESTAMERLGITTIATCHGPTIDLAHVGEAHEMMRSMPDVVVAPQPGQPVLDDIVAAMTAAFAD